MNSSMIIKEFLHFKSLKISVDKFLSDAKSIEEKFNLFEENIEGHGMEKKIAKTKDHKQLVDKIDEIIGQVRAAQKHFGMKM